MTAERTGAVLAAALLIPTGQAMQGQDTASAGPWDPRTEVSAEAAVARLGAKRALEIRPIVLAIRGLGVGTTAAGSAIVSTVAAVQEAKRALSATETPLELRVALPADVLFDFDEAELRADAVDALTRLATLVGGYARSTATIEGHTDSIGSDAYNQSLSERRAASVKRWLAEHAGIAPSRIAIRGWGRSRPVTTNSTETGRQRNRRVEVIILKTADRRTAP